MQEKIQSKKCGKCGEIKSIEMFSRNKRNRDKLEYRCKLCDKESRENYKKIHKKKIIEMTDLELLDDTIKWLRKKLYQKEWHQENPKKSNEYSKQWRLNHPQRWKEMQEKFRMNNPQLSKNYCLKNKEKIKERNKLRYWKDVEKSRKYSREQRKKHYNYDKEKQRNLKYREKTNERCKHRRQTDINYKITCALRDRMRKAVKGNQKSGSVVRDLGMTIEEFKKYIESRWLPGMSWDNYGYYGWHLDHIIPLSSFNLEDREQFLKACHYSNYQPLWAKDNFSKGNKII